jgi:HD-GYP domain-containing protein (c-di-GMP phosphodiesterase class II)
MLDLPKARSYKLPSETRVRDFLRPLAKKDLFTYYHSDRVSLYAGLIATALNCSTEFIAALRCVCRFHDIGKYEISKSILNKPGALNSQEWEIMKNHTVLGYEMIKESKALGSDEHLQEMAECMCCLHHEYENGTGYWGVKSGNIPLSTKICQLADIFDALTSKRTYKEACTPGEAVRIIICGDDRTRPENFDQKILSGLCMALPDIFSAHKQFVSMGEEMITPWGK